MKILSLAIALVAPSAIVSAQVRGEQSIGYARNAAEAADKAWNEIVTQAAKGNDIQRNDAPAINIQENKARKAKTEPEVRRDNVRNAAIQQLVAKLAKDFYTAHPEHVNAAAAKKLEAMASLLSVNESDQADEVVALKIATNYRANADNPARDRFEVAVLAERVQARIKGSTPFKNDALALEKIADRLQVEFSSLPDSYYFYANVARTADSGRAGRMARKLLKWADAPDEAKADARSIIDREAILGKPLPLRLLTTEGGLVDLSHQTGKITVLYVWSALTDSSHLPGFDKAAKQLPADAQVIYFSVAASAKTTHELNAQVPVPGTHCFEVTGAGGGGAQLLKLGHVPYVFVLNRDGNVNGFGPAELLPELLLKVKG